MSINSLTFWLNCCKTKAETEEAIQKVVIPDEEDGEKENNLYYDFHTLNKFSQEELKN